MSNYIVNTLLFQIFFIGVYELFFKKETFFTTNRFYLIGSFILSLVIPLIKIPNFITDSNPNLNGLVTQRLNEIVLSVNAMNETSDALKFSLVELIIIAGMAVSTLLFLSKLYRIYQLKKTGISNRIQSYTQVTLPKTDMVFSFLNTVYIGEEALENAGETILKHEMVHINQKHTYDLLFFEIMRIVFWFNPLVYLYQSKISEIHEYICDRLMSAQERKSKYELLLQQLFKTQNISFVNSFYKKSLIKKRIIMLQKDYSDKRKMFKYILVFPLIAAMLMYSSCSEETPHATSETSEVQESAAAKGSGETSKGIESVSVPFASVDKVPVFPGCENSEDARICFVSKVQEHIRKYFKYPEEAQLNNIQGRVFVQFTISTDGTVGFIRTRGPEKILEESARAILEKLPKMIPGEHNGKKVDVPFSIPISYKLK